MCEKKVKYVFLTNNDKKIENIENSDECVFVSWGGGGGGGVV